VGVPFELLLVGDAGCVLSLQIVVVVVVVGGVVVVVVATEVEIGLGAVTLVGQVSGVVVLWQQLLEQGEEVSVCFVVVVEYVVVVVVDD
jgi:hypothetical protein